VPPRGQTFDGVSGKELCNPTPSGGKACVGKGTCGLCRVRIVAGAQSLNPYTDEERKHLGNVYHITKVRLACRSKLSDGDVTIQVVRRKK